MKDTMKPFRAAITSVLRNNVTYGGVDVPLYDKKVWTANTPDKYIFFGSQREVNTTATDCSFECKSSIDLVIVDRTGSEVSQDIIDDISDQVYDLLLNSPGSNNLSLPEPFRLTNLFVETSVAGLVEITPTQSVLQKVITLSANILQ